MESLCAVFMQWSPCRSRSLRSNEYQYKDGHCVSNGISLCCLYAMESMPVKKLAKQRIP